MTVRIRLHLTAYDAKVLDDASDLLAAAARSAGVRTMGPTPLPIEVSSLTLIENSLPVSYELRSHQRRLDLLDPSPALVDTLVRLSLPAGVNVSIKS